jgi:DNA-binding NarL/FixJ family response regulator
MPACVPLLEILLSAQLARENLEKARETCARLEAIRVKWDDVRTKAVTDAAFGRLRSAEGDESARSRLKAAVEGFIALGLPLEAARAQMELARALAPNASAGAAAEARLALATFEQLGAARDADAAADLLRTLGEPSGRNRRRHSEGLTKRESEVLTLLAEGLSNLEIAERLYISRRTAEHHVASILSKLGLRSRTEATAYAMRASQDT